MKITKSQLKQIIKEELLKLQEYKGTSYDLTHTGDFERGYGPEDHDDSGAITTQSVALFGLEALQEITRTLDELGRSGMSGQASTIRNAVVDVLKSLGDYDTAKTFEAETAGIGG